MALEQGGAMPLFCIVKQGLSLATLNKTEVWGDWERIPPTSALWSLSTKPCLQTMAIVSSVVTCPFLCYLACQLFGKAKPLSFQALHVLFSLSGMLFLPLCLVSFCQSFQLNQYFSRRLDIWSNSDGSSHTAQSDCNMEIKFADCLPRGAALHPIFMKHWLQSHTDWHTFL